MDHSSDILDRYQFYIFGINNSCFERTRGITRIEAVLEGGEGTLVRYRARLSMNAVLGETIS